MITVYGLRLDGRIAYVGVARCLRKRLNRHESNARCGYTQALYEAIRVRGMSAFEPCTLAKTADIDQAFALEKQFIASAGTRTEDGGLNMTEGGEGIKLTPASLAHRARLVSRLWKNPEYRENALRNLAKSRTPEARSKGAKTLKQGPNYRDWLEGHRAMMRSRNASPTWREKTATNNRKKAADPEWRARMSAAAKRRSQTEEGRATLKAMVAQRQARRQQKAA